MSSNVKRRLAALAAVVLGMSGGLFVSSHTEATNGQKTYTAVADPPARLSGTAQDVTITLKNTSSNNISFNAANLSIPTGVSVVSVSPTVTPGPGSAQLVSSSTIQLRNLNTPQGSSVTVTFRASATPQAACTGFVFTSDVRQSNNFSGTYNQFTLSGTDAKFSGPCSSSTKLCPTVGSSTCTTGVIESTGGNTGEVILNSGTLGGSLNAFLTAGSAPDALDCSADFGYRATSDQLGFRFDTTVSTDGVTKTVVFTQTRPDSKALWEYQVCFQAPYPFPALKPSELAQDFALDDFSNNTVPGTSGTFKGLLLRCTAGKLPPCIAGVAFPMGTNLVTVTVTTPAKDPGMRF